MTAEEVAKLVEERVKNSKAQTTVMPTVIKRDGRRTTFVTRRIREAIRKAWRAATGANADERLIREVVKMVKIEILERFTDTVKVYEIHNVVEQTLLDLGHTNIAETYNSYRMQREMIRAKNTSVDHQISMINDPSVKNENANKDASTYSVQRDRRAGSVAKARGLAMLPGIVANAHLKGTVYFHDLDYSPDLPFSNCSFPDFSEMLTNGFTMGTAEIESAKSIDTAATILSQIIVAVASAQYGGITVERMDEVLAPFAKLTYDKHMKSVLEDTLDTLEIVYSDSEFDEMFEHLKEENFIAIKQLSRKQTERIVEKTKKKTIKSIYDACQTILYQIQTTSSTQGQTPFLSVGFGRGTNWFEREIQKGILAVQEKGVGARELTPIFPKLIFALEEGVNLRPEDPNYDIKLLAIRCSTKRMYPDVICVPNIERITGNIVSPMGCRSFLHGWTNPETGLQETVGRMNLGVVTINLPRVALETYHDGKDAFWNLLEERMEILHTALRFREKIVREALPENAPILYKSGGWARLKNGDSAGVGKLFDNWRASLSAGFIGIYETVQLFHGNETGEWEHDAEAKEFSLDILRFMKKLVDKWNDEDRTGSVIDGETGERCRGAKIGLYGTPSESLAGRFSRQDLADFGKVPHVTDKEGDIYYTNSFHLDVRKGEDQGWTPFKKLEWEKPYADFLTGFIHYAEWPNIKNNPEALEAMWDYAYEIGIGYFGANQSIDVCYKCGFEGEFSASLKGFKCPQCGNTGLAENGDVAGSVSVIRRVCGYLGAPVERPVAEGRLMEFTRRVKHSHVN